MKISSCLSPSFPILFSWIEATASVVFQNTLPRYSLAAIVHKKGLEYFAAVKRASVFLFFSDYRMSAHLFTLITIHLPLWKNGQTACGSELLPMAHRTLFNCNCQKLVVWFPSIPGEKTYTNCS